MDASYLFRVSNHHTPGCGDPPYIDGDTKGKYYGYFQNQHGEQALFIYDYNTQEGTVWLGDNGWDEAVEVLDGRATGLVMDTSEALWLQACWRAATGS